MVCDRYTNKHMFVISGAIDAGKRRCLQMSASELVNVASVISHVKNSLVVGVRIGVMSLRLHIDMGHTVHSNNCLPILFLSNTDRGWYDVTVALVRNQP